MKTVTAIAGNYLPEWWRPLKDWRQSPAGGALVFFALSTAVFILSQLFQWGGEDYRTLITDGAQALTAAGAFWITWKLSRLSELESHTRRAWRIASIAYLSYACGQALWFYYRQIEGIEPFPSFVDFAYLAFYPLMLYALLSFPTTKQAKTDRQKFLLDTATVMIAGTTVIWHFLIRPIIEKNTDWLKCVLNVAFLVGDMVLFLGIVTILLRRPPASVRRALLIIVGGLANLFVADIAFAYITLYDIDNSGPLVMLWVTGPFLLILASFFQFQSTAETQGASREEEFVPTFTWLPYLAIAIGYGVLLLSTRDHWGEPLGGVVFAAVTLTGVVVFRQLTFAKENARLHSEQAMRTSEMRFRTLIEHSSDVVMIFDAEGKISYQSPSVEHVLGYESGSIVGQLAMSFAHPDDIPAMKAASRLLIAHPDGVVTRECRFRHKDGSWRVLEGIAKIINDPETGVKGILLNARDINERRALEAKLKHQAFHDPLTNLANRTLFRSRVEESLINSPNQNSQIAVMFLDLDNFKNINDTLGHETGDKLLVEFTERLRLCVRAKDTTARLGGDEFAVLLDGENVESNAATVATRILESVQTSFEINNLTVKIGISIGIAFNDTVETDADKLLRNADVAMYIAKGKGKNRFVVFEDEMHRTLMDQIELENDLRQAIDEGQMTLNYQPIVSLVDGEISGTEALIRWHHPTRGYIPPLSFIPLAEQTGLIAPLGRWIMHQACVESRKLGERFGGKLSVTINISGKQIQHSDFIRDLSSVLDSTGIDPESVILELTESTMMENTEAMLKMLNQIKSLGIRLAIDDFGTGYSSLSYLQQFPVDILKIDRSFVDGIENSAQKKAVARTIISLSETLGLCTVAEGVENLEQSEMLRDLGCEFAQGYYFARPMPFEQIEELLASRSTNQTINVNRSSVMELVSPSIN